MAEALDFSKQGELLDFSSGGELLDFSTGGEPLVPDFSNGGDVISQPDHSLDLELRPAQRPGILKRLARGARSALSPLIGPSEEEKMENAVLIKGPDGTVTPEYKPLGDTVAKEGLLGVRGHVAESVERAAPTASTGEKLARGAARGALGALDTLFNPLLLALGPFAQGAPLLHRAITAGFSAQMLSQVPEMVGVLNKAVEGKDVETAAEALTATGLMGYFGYRGLKETVKPGLAQESPKLRELLTKRITEEYTPQQVREIYLRVNRSEATPAEAELVRYLNAELESPGVAVRKGVKFESTEPRVQNEKLRKWLGLDEATERTLIFPSHAATAREPIVPTQPPTESAANALQIAQTGSVSQAPQAVGVPGVPPGLRPAQVQPPATGQSEAPVGPGQTIDPEIERRLRQAQALAAIQTPPPKPSAEAKPTVETAPDLIDLLADQGLVIRGKKSAREGSAAYYGELYKEATSFGSVRKIMSNTRGQSPDEVADALRRSGTVPEGFSVDNLWESLIAAGNARRGRPGSASREATVLNREIKQAEDFAKTALQPRKDSEPLSIDQLIPGDEFELAGQKVQVKDLEISGDDVAAVILEDGRRFGVQRVAAGQVLQADTGSLKQAPRQEGFEPERAAMLPTERILLEAMLKEVPPALLEKREKLLQQAVTDGLKMDQLQSVEAAIAAIDTRWSLPALQEAVRHGSHGVGALEYLSEVAASDDRTATAVIQRAQQILQRVPRTKANRVVLDKGREPTRYDEILKRTPMASGFEVTGKELLQAISDRTKVPEYAELSKMLLDRGVSPRVVTFESLEDALAFYAKQPDVEPRLQGALGWYDGATDTIFVNGLERQPHLEATLLHELVHSASVSALYDQVLWNQVQEWVWQAQNVLDARDDIPNFQRIVYGTSDVAEMISEGFTNPEFRDFLRGIQIDGVSLLDRLIAEVTPRLQPNNIAKKPLAAPMVATTQEAGRRGLIRSEIEGQAQFEQESQSVQVSTLLNLLERHGTSPVNPILGLLGYDDLSAIQLQTNTPRMRYEDFKQQNPDAAYLPAVALEASLKLVLERDRWRKLRAQLGEQEALITSKSFQNKIGRFESKAIQKQALEDAWDNFRASIKDAIASAKTALQGEARNEERARQLLQQISSLESVEGFHLALEHALESMVNALAQSPHVAQFLAQDHPTAANILGEFNRIRAQLGHNPPASDIVLQWAGELLGRSWVEAQRMILSALVRDNLKLQQGMTGYEKAIFRGLRDKPKSTIGEILKEAGKTAKANALTKLAWSRLRHEVSRELEKWDELQQAAGILDQVEADPEYKAHANAVFKDAKIEDRPDAVVRVGDKNVQLRDLNYDAIAGSPIFPMPDGSVVQVNLLGDTRAFDAERKKMEAALDVLRDWKDAQDALPESQRDPSYEYFVGHLRALEGIYLSTRVTHPSSLVSIGNPFSAEQPGSWDMPTFLLDDLGTRVGGAAKVAAANFNRVHALGRHLLVRQHELANAQYAAANSYKFKGSQNERALQLYDHVLQPLFAAAQRPGFKLQVGMVVGEGHVVTKEVVALLRLQRDLAEEAFKIVQEQVPRERPTSAFPPVIQDQINGVLFHGQAIKVNETTLPFGGWHERATAFVEDYITKKRQGNVEAAVGAMARNYDLIFSYLADRASIVELGPSPSENAYQLLVNRLRTNPPTSAQRNLKWIAEQIAGINGADPKDVAQQLASELDALIEHVSAMRKLEEEHDPTVAVSQPHQESSFTARRHDRSVPYYFVRYGFRTGANFLDFIGNVHAHAFERFIEALGEVQRDLERQRDELSVRYDQRLQELLTGGTPEPKAKRKAMKDVKFANALAHLNGETTDQYRSLEKRLHQVRKAIQAQKDVFLGNKEAEMDIRTWTKVSRAVVGSLLTPVTVLIRNGTGLAYLGAAMARMRRNAGWSSVDVAARLVWDGLLRHGIATPAFKGLKYALGRGGLKPWFETLQNRLDRNIALEQAGLVSPIDVANEFIAKMRNLENAGIVLDDKRGAGERAILSLLGVFDALVLTAVAKPLFPRLGDQVINGASDSATVAMVGELEKRLRELFKLWTDAGRIDNRFDFANPTSQKNVLSHDEVFPGAFGTSSRQKMEMLRQAFEWSGTTFDRAAFDFLQKLRNGQDSQLLNDEQMIGLKDQVLAQVNVPHALNRPAWTHQRDIFHSLFAPLVGWNIHALRQFVRYFSRPGVSPGETRAHMWFIMGLVLLPILLALTAGQDIGTEQLIRLVYRGMGKERSTRQPWEQPPDRMAMALLISAVNPVPYVSMAVNAALNDSPNRASFDPTPVLINKAKDVATYVGGVVQTGDPQHGLERMISSLVPIVAPLIAQMPQQEGIQDALNARRLLTRHGDPDLLRPKYTGSQPATPLTPFGQKMMNAAMIGDDAAFQAAYQEALAKAREMGKANPEQVVKQIFMAQNVYSRAFKQKLSPEQRAELLAKLDPRERAIIKNAERRFDHAGSLIGAEPTFERTPSRGGSGLGGFASRRSRSSRGRRPRLARGRRPRLARGGRGSRLRRPGIRRLSRGLRA